LLDKGGCIIGILAGYPKEEGWKEACSRAFFTLDYMAQKVVCHHQISGAT